MVSLGTVHFSLGDSSLQAHLLNVLKIHYKTFGLPCHIPELQDQNSYRIVIILYEILDAGLEGKRLLQC